MLRRVWALLLILAFPIFGEAQTQPYWNTVRICSAPTVTAGAYGANNAVGTGLSFTNAFRIGMTSGTISAITVTDKSGNAVQYDFIPLSAALASTTVADKTAVTFAVADLPKVLPGAQILTSYAFTGAPANGFETWTGALPVVSSDSTLRALLITRGAPTYGTTSDINVCITIWQD